MAADIFGVDTSVGGAWSVNGAVINIGEADDLVLTSVQLQYTRTIQKFSALNNDKRYLIAGEGQGQGTLGAIIGPSKGIKKFLDKYAKACSVEKNNMKVVPVGIPNSCDETQERVEFHCSGVLLSSIQIAVQEQQGLTVINAGMGFTFLGLNVS
jgi:hypothetical protein